MKRILALAIFALMGLLIGRYAIPYNSNDILLYGDSGRPKNCRAIIQANIDGVRYGKFPAEDGLASIERNCGALSSGWKE